MQSDISDERICYLALFARLLVNRLVSDSGSVRLRLFVLEGACWIAR